jgi:hypothetical protein
MAFLRLLCHYRRSGFALRRCIATAWKQARH